MSLLPEGSFDILSDVGNIIRDSQEALYAGNRVASSFNKTVYDINRGIGSIFGNGTEQGWVPKPQNPDEFFNDKGYVPKPQNPDEFFGKEKVSWTDAIPGPHNVCSLTPLDGGLTITAPFMSPFKFPNFPLSFTDNTDKASYDSVPCLYRAGAMQGYKNTTNRVIAFELMFVASITQGDVKRTSEDRRAQVEYDAKKNVVEKVNFLKASQYPDYDHWAPPPRFMLTMGKLLSLTGVITQCNVTWGHEGLFTSASVYPLIAKVGLQFMEVTRVAKSWQNMATGSPQKSFSGYDVQSGAGLETWGSNGISGNGTYTNPYSNTRSNTTLEGMKSEVDPTDKTFLSSFHESKGDPAKIAHTDGDHGGASYGTFQFSEKGSVQEFINDQGYSKDFEGLTPGTAEFDERWKYVADRDGEKFAQAQMAQIEKNFYNPVVSGSAYKNAGLEKFNDSSAIQNAMFSMAVQHGPGGANNIITRALSGKDVSSMTESDVINALYDERSKIDSNGQLAYFSSSPKLKDSLVNRFIEERTTALQIAEKYPMGAAQASAGSTAAGTSSSSPPLAASHQPTAYKASTAEAARQTDIDRYLSGQWIW